MLYPNSLHEGKSHTSAAILLCGIMELSVDIIVNIVHCVHLGQECSKSFREFAKFFPAKVFILKINAFVGHCHLKIQGLQYFKIIILTAL